MNVTARVMTRGIIYSSGRVDGEWAASRRLKLERLDARSCYCVMSCGVQTSSRSASNPNSATASRDFAMNGTSTSAPGLATSSRRHSTASSRPTSRRRRDNPSPAGSRASSTTAGAPRSTDPIACGGPARHPDPHHRQPGRLLDGHDHRGRLPQPAAHRRPRLRPAVGVHALLDTLPARRARRERVGRAPGSDVYGRAGTLRSRTAQYSGSR